MRDLLPLITLLAAVYHESGRPSVASGHTLAHALGQARPFTEFNGLNADARRGRELTATRLLERFEFCNFERSAPAMDGEVLARAIHEAEREAVDRGWTVVKLDPPRPWIPFDDLPKGQPRRWPNSSQTSRPRPSCASPIARSAARSRGKDKSLATCYKDRMTLDEMPVACNHCGEALYCSSWCPRRIAGEAPLPPRRKTKHEQLLYAEEQAARHLGNFNEESERGAIKTAAKSLEKAQRWLDRANDLSGRGSD